MFGEFFFFDKGGPWKKHALMMSLLFSSDIPFGVAVVDVVKCDDGKAFKMGN
jgi:hypothetical protein